MNLCLVVRFVFSHVLPVVHARRVNPKVEA